MQKDDSDVSITIVASSSSQPNGGRDSPAEEMQTLSANNNGSSSSSAAPVAPSSGLRRRQMSMKAAVQATKAQEEARATSPSAALPFAGGSPSSNSGASAPTVLTLLPQHSMDDDSLITMTVLSRVVERFRFLLPDDSLIDTELTLELLCWMLTLDTECRKPNLDHKKVHAFLRHQQQQTQKGELPPAVDVSSLMKSSTSGSGSNTKSSSSKWKSVSNSLANLASFGSLHASSSSGSNSTAPPPPPPPSAAAAAAANSSATSSAAFGADAHSVGSLVSSPSLGVANFQAFSYADLLKDDVALLGRRLWEQAALLPFKTTLRQLLDFFSTNSGNSEVAFPFTTKPQRDRLRELYHLPVVSVTAAAAALAPAATPGSGARAGTATAAAYFTDEAAVRDANPVLRFLFGGGTRTSVPSFVFSSMVEALAEHPEVSTAAMTISGEILQIKTRMALAPLLVILFIVTLVLTSTQLDIDTHFTISRLFFQIVTDDWQNGCPAGGDHDDDGRGGPTSPRCDMIKRTVFDMKTTQDLTDFFRHFIVENFWPGEDNETQLASESDYLGNVLVGGVLLKVSPIVDSLGMTRQNKSVCPTRSCDSLNLSTSLYEFAVDRSFACSAFDGVDYNSVVTISFASNYSAAKALFESWTPDWCEEEAAVGTIQFGAWSPSARVLVWTTVSVVVPKAGYVVPRVYVQSLATEGTLSSVAIYASSQLLALLYLLFLTWERWRPQLGVARQLFTFQNMLQVVLTVLSISALVIIASLPSQQQILEEIVAVTDHVPAHLDAYVNSFTIGMDILAVWLIGFYLSACLILSQILGLEALRRLFELAGADVAGLVAVFAIVEISFLAVSRALFGSTITTFAFSSSAAVWQLGFFWGDFGGASAALFHEHPVLGPLFFFAHLLFVSFVALNLIISLFTSSLESSSKRSNLHQEIFAKLESDASNFREGEERWFWLRSSGFSLAILSSFIDSFSVAATRRWTRFHVLLAPLFERSTREDPVSTVKEVLTAAVQLIEFANVKEKTNNTNNNNMLSSATSSGLTAASSSTAATTPVVVNDWNSALRRGVVRYNAVPNRQLLLLERVILGQSSSDVLRDTALARCLILYDELATDTEVTCELQKSELQRVSKQEDEAASPQHTAHLHSFTQRFTLSGKLGGGGAGSNSNLQFFDPTGSGHSLFDSLGDASGSLASPLLPSAAPASSGSSSGSATPSPTATTANVAVSPTAAATTTGSTPKTPSQQKQQQSPTSSRFSATARSMDFISNAYILRDVKRHLFFPLVFVAVLALYCAFIIPLLSHRESSTWLSKNLVAALSEYPWETFCSDENCTSGMMHTKTLADVDHLGEIDDYLSTRFVPFVFPDPDNLPFEIPMKFKKEHAANATFPARWDEYIRRIGPVTVRTIDAAPKKCLLPYSRAASSPSAGSTPIKTMRCYHESLFSTADKVLSADSSLIPPAALKHSDSCIENRITIAPLHTYPCAGYTTTVWNASQLRALSASGWIGSQTRLLVLSAIYKSTYTFNEKENGRELRVRIDIYIESGVGGHASAFVWTTPLGEEHELFNKIAVAGWILLAAELLFFFVRGVESFVRRRRAQTFQDRVRADHALPPTPIVALCCSVWMAVAAIASSSDGSGFSSNDAKSHCVAALTVSASASFLARVLLPTLKFLSHRAAYLDRLVLRALGAVSGLIPHLAVVLVAFVFGGHVLFGRAVVGYATLRQSLATTMRGLLGDLDLSEELFQMRPLAGLLYTLCFVLAVIILSSVITTMMTLSAENAKTAIPCVALIRRFADFTGQPLLCDEAVGMWLAWRLLHRHHWLRRAVSAVASCFGGDDGGGSSSASRRRRRRRKAAASCCHCNCNSDSDDGGCESDSDDVSSSDEERDDTNAALGLLQLSNFKNQQQQNSNNVVLKRIMAASKTQTFNPIRRQIFISHNGQRFARPSEVLAMVIPTHRLNELAACLRLRQVPEVYLLSIALYLARASDRIKSHRDYRTLDGVLEAVKARAVANAAASPVNVSSNNNVASSTTAAAAVSQQEEEGMINVASI